MAKPLEPLQPTKKRRWLQTHQSTVLVVIAVVVLLLRANLITRVAFEVKLDQDARVVWVEIPASSRVDGPLPACEGIPYCDLNGLMLVLPWRMVGRGNVEAQAKGALGGIYAFRGWPAVVWFFHADGFGRAVTVGESAQTYASFVAQMSANGDSGTSLTVGWLFNIFVALLLLALCGGILEWRIHRRERKT
jgi:hypothetical protein